MLKPKQHWLVFLILLTVLIGRLPVTEAFGQEDASFLGDLALIEDEAVDEAEAIEPEQEAPKAQESLPTAASPFAVSTFAEFKTQMQAAASRGGLTTIEITDSFDFPETIRLETTQSNVNIVFRSSQDIVLGVEGFYRHFEISTPGTFILELKGVVLDGSGQGGGIHFSGGKFYLFSGTIANCLAYNGGGLSAAGEAIVEGMHFYGNSTVKQSGNSDSNSGGAIYMRENGRLLLMDSTLIEYNGGPEVTSGGGVHVAAGCTVEMRAGIIQYNEAWMGGGISLDNQSTLYVNGYIQHNTAKVSGGGIRGAYTSAASSGAITETSYIYINGHVKDNQSEVTSAGIYGGEVTVGRGGFVSRNTVTGPGSEAGISCAHFVMEDGIVSYNTVVTPANGLVAGVGVRCRSAVINGGEISNNTYINDTGLGTGGGGIFCSPILDGDTVIINGGVIKDNKARNGGGVFMFATSYARYTTPPVMQINGGEISGNQAVNGGGIYSYGFDIEVKDAEISGNRYDTYGGGIYAIGEKLTIQDSIIRGNRPTAASDTQYGGGVYLNFYKENSACVVEISGTTLIEDNESANGAGMYLGVKKEFSPGQLRIFGDVSVANNRASANGGGMFFSNLEAALYGPLQIHNNSAPNGGGILLNRTHLTLDGQGQPLQLTENQAGYGGALYGYNAAMEVELLADVTLSGNTAEEDGGAIWVDDLTKLRVAADTVSFQENRAAMGYEMTAAEDIALHEALIQSTTFSQPFRYAYNNYDVVYAAGDPWEELVTVTFESNGGSPVPAQDLEVGSYVPVPAAPTKPSYSFAGWYEDIFQARQWDFQAETVSEDLTLYALWLFDFTPPAASYTVTYHGNGGTGSHSVSEMSHTVLLPAATGISRSGYSFRGWNERADGAGIRYSPGQQLILSADLELYAQWQKNSGGGNGGGSDKEHNPNQEQQPEHPDRTEEHRRYIQGYPDGSFQPGGNLTRAEMAMIFFNLIEATDKQTTYTSAFTDMEPGAWYDQAVASVEKQGIMTGYPDGSFGPNRPITRAELAAACANFFGLESGDQPFPDVSTVHWAGGYIANAYAKGWITGYPDGTFRPDQAVTRAEAVTMLNKILNRKLRLTDIPERAKRFTDVAEGFWAYADIIEAAHSHTYARQENGYELWQQDEAY